MANTILLIGDHDKYQDERRAASGSAIKPGMLIIPTAADEVNVHATAGGKDDGLVALEDDLQGLTIDTAYTPGGVVFHHRSLPGDMLNLILKAGEHAYPNSYLTSYGDGTVKVATGGDEKSWRAGQEVDLSASGSDARCPAYRV